MTQEQVDSLTDQIQALTRAYRAGYETETRAKLEELNGEVLKLQRLRAVAIAAGCSPCPSCGEKPVGMVQRLVVNRAARDGFEVGCEHCLDHRASGTDLAGTRAAWEKGPSIEEKTDETGAIIARGVYGWKLPSDGRTIEKTERGILSRLADGTAIEHWRDYTVPQRQQLARAVRAASAPVAKVEAAAG